MGLGLYDLILPAVHAFCDVAGVDDKECVFYNPGVMDGAVVRDDHHSIDLSKESLGQRARFQFL